MRFAQWTYRLAAAWGVLVLAPLLFLRRQIEAQTTPFTHPEYFYGFLAVALVFQLVFFLVSRDPVRLRPLMPITALEKWSWGAVAWIAFAKAQTQPAVVFFATVDMALGLLFLVAWARTPKA
ncbi:hypothetical protein [Phenylobacterium sp.]|jgi:hypothetical protein|uniref:hypothetical protein n=1 Tax=Phenylobacterium sp. TaxID=1871053 RepID=UPI002F41F3C3